MKFRWKLLILLLSISISSIVGLRDFWHSQCPHHVQSACRSGGIKSGKRSRKSLADADGRGFQYAGKNLSILILSEPGLRNLNILILTL